MCNTGFHPLVSDSVGRVGPRICISNQFLGDDPAAGLETAFEKHCLKSFASPLRGTGGGMLVH